jgi:ABC-type amino acid transport substrate-binding protein
LQGPTTPQLAQLPDFIQFTDRLAKAREAKKLRVAYATNPPFSRLEENNAPGGFEVELATAIAQRVLGAADAVEFVPLSGDPAAVLADVDIVVGGIARTQAAERTLDFAMPTYRNGANSLAIAMPTRQSALRDAVNLALLQMQSDGTYAELYARYFPDSQLMILDAWR